MGTDSSEVRRSARAERHPWVTVVVPALNEEMRIGDCLDALARQTYPADRYEVIVVDNGSTDRTCEIVLSSDVKLLRQPQRSAYRARNLAIASSEGDYVAFTDADCIPEADWLEKMVVCAERCQAWIVGGLTRYSMLDDTLGNRLLVQTHQPELLRHSIEENHCVAGGNMLVLRRAFDELGPFRPVRSGSDIEFSKRLARAGHPSEFVADAIVDHQCDLSDVEYLRRAFRIRFGQVTHAGGRRGVLAMVWHLRHLPWKPGFRAVRNLAAATENCRPISFMRAWSYRWAVRWAGFAGELYALSGWRSERNAVGGRLEESRE